MTHRLIPCLVALAVLLTLTAGAALAQQPPRLEPKRLSSTGDSITEAIDAELPLANHWTSWANGYSNFWTRLFGLNDPNSHNQRISRHYGSGGRVNYMEAKSGADSYDLPGQTAASVSHDASYVTVFMGHNDVCQDDFADIPTDAEFEANVRASLDNLRDGLDAGATVSVIGIVDIYKLWELGDELDALGILPCKVLWLTTLLDLFPCSTMLDPFLSDADRRFTRQRNGAFNRILRDLVVEYSAADPDHYYEFTDVIARREFIAEDVSWIDCFHPSDRGQEKLSDLTWDVGPFFGQ